MYYFSVHYFIQVILVLFLSTYREVAWNQFKDTSPASMLWYQQKNYLVRMYFIKSANF